MRKSWMSFAIAIGFAVAVAIPAYAGNGNGNGLPSGDHYNLVIKGSPKAKVPSMTGSDRHTIFMPLVTSGDAVNQTEPDAVSPDSAIYLEQGATFQVCDGNGWDTAYDCSGTLTPITGPGVIGNGATFQLPCDSIASDGTAVACTGASASYQVWIAALGKPGGTASLTTCAYDTATTTEVCNSTNTVVVRNTGKPKWDNVTTNLTTLTVSGTVYPLFASGFTNFLWDYDNNNLKTAQVRFYLVP